MPSSDADSDAQFELAQRALSSGWVTREQVEDAILADERSPGPGLLSFLPLTREQRTRLRSGAPPPS
jgi:hypothetical protein